MGNRPDADPDRLPEDGDFVIAQPVGPDEAEVATPGDDSTVGGNSIASQVSEEKTSAHSPANSYPAPAINNEPGFKLVTPLDPDGPEESLRRQTAVAGSVTAVFLGVWSIVFSFFTGLAVINALLGVAFAIWGLTSTRSTLAIIGLILCTAGFLMTIVFASR